MFPGKRSWLAEGYWHMLLEAIWDGVSRDGPLSVLFSWRDCTRELEKPIRRGFFFFFFFLIGVMDLTYNFKVFEHRKKTNFPFFFFFLTWQLRLQRVKLKGTDLSVIGPSGILRKKGLTYNFRYCKFKMILHHGVVPASLWWSLQSCDEMALWQGSVYVSIAHYQHDSLDLKMYCNPAKLYKPINFKVLVRVDNIFVAEATTKFPSREMCWADYNLRKLPMQFIILFGQDLRWGYFNLAIFQVR